MLHVNDGAELKTAISALDQGSSPAPSATTISGLATASRTSYKVETECAQARDRFVILHMRYATSLTLFPTVYPAAQHCVQNAPPLVG